MTTRKHCAYTACGLPLRADRAQFEVRVAAERQAREEQAVGTYCSPFCWEAEQARKAVHSIIKSLHADAEHVLSDEHKLIR